MRRRVRYLLIFPTFILLLFVSHCTSTPVAARPEEAIPWLQKAIRARNYCCYQFAHYNLGRVRLGQGRVAEARREFERALAHDPNYLPARQGLEEIRERERKSL
jgi:Tfp pilus assembly protein PilF